MRLAVNFITIVNDNASFISKHLEEILVGVIIAAIAVFMTVIVSKLLERHFAKTDRREQQRRELEQKKQDTQKQLKRCLQKIIKYWEDPIKTESKEEETRVKSHKLQNNGTNLKTVVQDHKEYLLENIVKEVLDIAREIEEVCRLNVSAQVANKPHDERPDVIFKERGGRVVERAKELIKRL